MHLGRRQQIRQERTLSTHAYQKLDPFHSQKGAIRDKRVKISKKGSKNTVQSALNLTSEVQLCLQVSVRCMGSSVEAPP